MTKDTTVGIFSVLLGVGYLVSTFRIPVLEAGDEIGPRVFPFMISAVVICCGLALILKELYEQEPESILVGVRLRTGHLASNPSNPRRRDPLRTRPGLARVCHRHILLHDFHGLDHQHGKALAERRPCGGVFHHHLRRLRPGLEAQPSEGHSRRSPAVLMEERD